MNKIDIKTLSINEAWKGRRYKTDKYDKYIHDLLFLLPPIKLPLPPYALYLVVGYSNSAADIDNCLKPFVDCLQKKYGFNDKLIYSLFIQKEIVKKGKEFISFSIKSL